MSLERYTTVHSDVDPDTNGYDNDVETDNHLSSFLELAIDQRKTSGDIPPSTVGSTVTCVGKTVYVIAGRLGATRRMMSNIYALDLDTYIWTKVAVKGANQLTARYFHSAGVYGDLIVIFGGMSVQKNTNDTLCVLDDIAIFDTRSNTWQFGPSSEDPHSKGQLIPRPRYAHLSAMSGDKFVIAGGQTLDNKYLEDAAVFDIHSMSWLSIHPMKKEFGAYRSMMCTSDHRPEYAASCDQQKNGSRPDSPELVTSVSPVSARTHPPGGPLGETGRRQSQTSGSTMAEATSANTAPSTPRRPNLRKRSASQAPDVKRTAAANEPTNPIYTFSNYNFTDVMRELHKIEDLSKTTNGSLADFNECPLKGPVLPTGMRFPMGTIVGDHMLVYGSHISNNFQRFHIWSLHLPTMQWAPCDLGGALTTGSWNRGLYCNSKGLFLIFGHRGRSLIEDYNHRTCNFDHVTAVELEVFGIIRPADATMSANARRFGLLAMQEPQLSDTDILTKDGTIIPINSRILSTKWPGVLDILRSPVNPNRPLSQATYFSRSSRFSLGLRPQSMQSAASRLSNASVLLNESATRSRCVYLPFSHALVYAFVHFLYTDALPAAMEKQVSRICPLLMFCSTLEDQKNNPNNIRLIKLCRDCLHRQLDIDNAAYVYEVATLSGQRALQVRALTLMVAARTSPDAKES